MAFDTVATRVSALFRKIGSVMLNTKARLRGQAFVCGALQGNGHPGVCVNSDLMLSCGYRDTDGTGQIGDLREAAFRGSVLW